eukprot:TRINITY_DN42374_c0_g1_i1.p1 TRINITY_DN42374_c0_g1~~TRINITY_DN42374_c0_g1_i1.p1  ORF type:complete len:346 (-),score=71.81 TRINITY_DN42374_c0_g1_i1:328-1365(-)
MLELLRPRSILTLASLFLFILPYVATAVTDQKHPRYARVDGNIETVWQPPHGTPKGVVFIAHGCQHQGTDIFSNIGRDGWDFKECKTSNLGSCLGLPEEVRLVKAARARGYVAMAVSGGSGRKSCWSMARDADRVKKAVEYVKNEEGLPEDAPVLATGASSGGAFMGLLAAPLERGGLPHLKCIIPQIMEVNGAPNRGVPTLFVHMPRDRRTATGVASDIQMLQKLDIRTDEIRVNPVPVTADLLQRCVRMEVAQDIVKNLEADSILDEKGFLKTDARARLWVNSVQRALSAREKSDSLQPDESCMAELMNVAWAMHEFTSEHADQMLDFCEHENGHQGKPTADL